MGKLEFLPMNSLEGEFIDTRKQLIQEIHCSFRIPCHYFCVIPDSCSGCPHLVVVDLKEKRYQCTRWEIDIQLLSNSDPLGESK